MVTAAHPDFGFNETVSASSLLRPTDFILLADAGRSDNTPSRGGMYPQPWAFDISSQSRMLPRHAKGHCEYRLRRWSCPEHQPRSHVAVASRQRLAPIPGHNRRSAISKESIRTRRAIAGVPEHHFPLSAARSEKARRIFTHQINETRRCVCRSWRAGKRPNLGFHPAAMNSTSLPASVRLWRARLIRFPRAAHWSSCQARTCLR